MPNTSTSNYFSRKHISGQNIFKIARHDLAALSMNGLSEALQD